MGSAVLAQSVAVRCRPCVDDARNRLLVVVEPTSGVLRKRAMLRLAEQLGAAVANGAFVGHLQAFLEEQGGLSGPALDRLLPLAAGGAAGGTCVLAGGLSVLAGTCPSLEAAQCPDWFPFTSPTRLGGL